MILIIMAVLSFLVGSIPVGLLISKLKGIDIRAVGSGNIGATNVFRNIGKKEALVTLIGDMAKGAVPVLFAWQLFPGDTLRVGIVGISAILGHDFSVFLRFKGGKGVATSLGVLLPFSPLVGLISVGVWIVVFAVTKYSSLSAIISFLFLPLNIYLIDNTEGKIAFSFLISLLIIVRHKDNILKLVKGEESRIKNTA